MNELARSLSAWLDVDPGARVIGGVALVALAVWLTIDAVRRHVQRRWYRSTSASKRSAFIRAAEDYHGETWGRDRPELSKALHAQRRLMAEGSRPRHRKS
jgi:hypothetical protein